MGFCVGPDLVTHTCTYRKPMGIPIPCPLLLTAYLDSDIHQNFQCNLSLNDLFLWWLH